MSFDLTDTTASKINSALLDARRRNGSSATGAVLSLVIVTDEHGAYDAMRAATDAGREHPSRMLVVVTRGGRGQPRLDAEIRAAGERSAGEVVIMRMYGELAEHADSVVLPLLLPDAPVVAWWPGNAPESPGEDPLGRLSARRITDAAACDDPLSALALRAGHYTPGDTDLSWTRLTMWRTVLAATLDTPFDPITGGVVTAEPDSPSAALLVAWLRLRLGADIALAESDGPGITGVTLTTEGGDIVLDRPDGRLAVLTRPRSPVRSVALQRRELTELIGEELRRLDEDDVYAATLSALPAVVAAG